MNETENFYLPLSELQLSANRYEYGVIIVELLDPILLRYLSERAEKQGRGPRMFSTQTRARGRAGFQVTRFYIFFSDEFIDSVDARSEAEMPLEEGWQIVENGFWKTPPIDVSFREIGTKDGITIGDSMREIYDN